MSNSRQCQCIPSSGAPSDRHDPIAVVYYAGRKGRYAIPLAEPLECRALLSAAFHFEAISYLGDPAPGPGAKTLINDFEPGAINNRGQVAFAADLSSGGEGFFLRDPGKGLVALALTGDDTPDGAMFGSSFLGDGVVNDAGDAPFAFQRTPEVEVSTGGPLFGGNGGLYLFSHVTHKVTPLVLPGDAAPGAGTFEGVSFHPAVNNAGTIAFIGIVPTTMGPAGATLGLGQAIYFADAKGHVSAAVPIGQPVPGGNLDFAGDVVINNAGDIAFEGHIRQDPFINYLPANFIFNAGSVYVRHHDGTFESIAHIGDKAAGGGTFKFAFGGVLNDQGDLAYCGALPAKVAGTGHNQLDTDVGIFLHDHRSSGGSSHDTVIIRPGDALPGGGHLVTAENFVSDLAINNSGVVTFSALLDTSTGGLEDTGLYRWQDGTLRLLARSGMKLPGIGTIKALQPPVLLGAPFASCGASSNERGQVLFAATLTNDKSALLVATPTGRAAGIVFNDRNGNLKNDGGAERGVTGVIVFLDQNGNGKLDTGERNTKTDAHGHYQFAHLAAGRYAVRVVLPKGARQVKPSRGDAHVVTLDGGERFTDEDFAFVFDG